MNKYSRLLDNDEYKDKNLKGNVDENFKAEFIDNGII